MSVRNQVRIIIYRINQKGLEIFLVNPDGKDNWEFPQGKMRSADVDTFHNEEKLIELEPLQLQDGLKGEALAIEGDWHEIPSIRGIIKQDVRIVKDQIKQRLPDLEKGTYFAMKEAIKKVLPEEYAALKELKEILTDRNQVKYI